MRQMKKKIIIAIIVTLLLTAAVAVAINYLIVKEKDTAITELEKQVADIRAMAFAVDLEADTTITQSVLKQIDYKQSSLANGAYFYEKQKDEKGNYMKNSAGEYIWVLKQFVSGIDESGIPYTDSMYVSETDVIERVVKTNVSANTPVFETMLYPKAEEPVLDERIQEFNFIQIPSDLNENDYVDIRIHFSTGEDYSVLIGKKIERIAGDSTIFIKLNEEEIMAMGSAIIEAYMQKGVKLYANKYTAPITQLYDEKIVDYVAKYDYAVEKLMAEKVDMTLRKEAVEVFEKEGLFTKVDSATSGLDSSVVGTIRYTALKGETLIENDEEVTLEDNREVTLNVIKNNEKQLMLAEGSWNLITKEYKERLLAQSSEVAEFKIEDLENEILALYAGIKEEYIKEIKLASLEENETVLTYYRAMNVLTPTRITRSYPVRKEVLAVIKNNPNLLEIIKAEFNTTSLLNTRIDEYEKLEAEYDATFDEYKKEQIKQKMDDLVNSRIENVEKSIEAEIAAQKAERVSYLESLING